MWVLLVLMLTSPIEGFPSVYNVMGTAGPSFDTKEICKDFAKGISSQFVGVENIRTFCVYTGREYTV